MRLVLRPSANYWRIIYDSESAKWEYKSRTLTVKRADGSYFSQLPSVYGYSSVPDPGPDNYRVDETGMEDDYYRINDYNTAGQYDARGRDRCENYLFGDSNALYNTSSPDGRGFPKRELLTMSGNILRELEWITENGIRYLRFQTVKPEDDLHLFTHESHPHLVHQYKLVMVENDITVTKPVVNREGYVFFFLTSKLGYAFIPESQVRSV